VEKLSDEFSTIKNFHLMYDDEKGRILFEFIIKRISEINSFKSLFVQHFLPEASRLMVKDLNELNKSRYRKFINISKEDVKENYYETIRLAYIGMFHKYESFIDELIEKAEMLISDVGDINRITLSQFVKKSFNYDIKDWKNSPIVERINWICNCNKHFDGYPRKSNKPIEFLTIPENEKLKLTKEDFIRDIDALSEQYQLTLNTVISLAMFKMLSSSSIQNDIIGNTDQEKLDKLISTREQAEKHLRMLLSLNKY